MAKQAKTTAEKKKPKKKRNGDAQSKKAKKGPRKPRKSQKESRPQSAHKRLYLHIPWLTEQLKKRLTRDLQRLREGPNDPIFFLLDDNEQQAKQREQISSTHSPQLPSSATHKHPGILKLKFVADQNTTESAAADPHMLRALEYFRLPEQELFGAVVSCQDAAVTAERLQDGLIESTAAFLIENIEQFISPEYQEQIVQDKNVFNQFPWWDAHPTGALILSMDQQHTHRMSWPPEAAPFEVIEWSRKGLKKIGDTKLAKAIVKNLKENQNINWFSWEQEPGHFSRRSLVGLAHLYIAERRIRDLGNPKSPNYTLFSVETPTVRTATGLCGAELYKLHKKARATHRVPKPEYKDPERVVFTFNEGTQLELPFDKGAAPLIVIARKYGAAAVRDILAFYLFNWSARVSANEPIWWWPDEHLEVVGLSKSKAVRKSLMDRMKALTQTHLTVHYSKGRPLRGPIIADTGLTDTHAHRMMLHPALYRGVTGLEGEIQRYWWPLPLKALQLPTNAEASHVHILSVVAGQLWRAALPETAEGDSIKARIKVERLNQYLNIYTGDDRHRQTRAADILRRTLDKAHEVDILGSWRCEGELENPNGVIILQAGELASGLARGDIRVERPSWLPSSSDDLRDFMKQKGWSAAKTARIIGVSPRSLQNVVQYGSERPISLNVRHAFRRLLWPGFNEPE